MTLGERRKNGKGKSQKWWLGQRISGYCDQGIARGGDKMGFCCGHRADSWLGGGWTLFSLLRYLAAGCEYRDHRSYISYRLFDPEHTESGRQGNPSQA